MVLCGHNVHNYVVIVHNLVVNVHNYVVNVPIYVIIVHGYGKPNVHSYVVVNVDSYAVMCPQLCGQYPKFLSM